MIILLWYLFKLALILIPLHFWGEYRTEASYLDQIRNQPLAQVKYLVPTDGQGGPVVSVTVSYPRQVIAGQQAVVTYEIENYDAKEDLEFDLHLRSVAQPLDPPTVSFNGSGPVRFRQELRVDPGAKDPVLEFQPRVRYQGEEYHYATVRQIQVHAAKSFFDTTVWMWLDLALAILLAIAWLAFLIFV